MPAEALAKAGCFGGFRRSSHRRHGCEAVALHKVDEVLRLGMAPRDGLVDHACWRPTQRAHNHRAVDHEKQPGVAEIVRPALQILSGPLKAYHR